MGTAGSQMEGTKNPELETQETHPESNKPRDKARACRGRRRRLPQGRRLALRGPGRAEGQGSAWQGQQVARGAWPEESAGG